MRPSRSKDRIHWYRSLCNECVSIWEEARKYGHTHEWILEQRRIRVFNNPRYEMLSNEERSNICAVFTTMVEVAYRRDIIWRMGTKDSIRPEGAKWDDEMSDLCQKKSELYGGHFWRGTDHVFSEYKVINP